MKRIGTALRAAVSLGLCAALLAGCSLLPSDPAPEQPVPTDPLTGQEQLWPGQRPVAVSIENASDSTLTDLTLELSRNERSPLANSVVS